MPSFTLLRVGAGILLLMTAPALASGLGTYNSFETRLLAAHNRERSALGVAPLRWNDDLAEAAARWAHHLAKTGRFEHSPDDPRAEPQGENLWAGTRNHYQPEAMVGLWIAEKHQFKPAAFPYNSRSGRVEDVSHFTQVVWRGTQELGCALSRGAQEDVLVCRYSQAGNIIGQKPF